MVPCTKTSMITSLIIYISLFRMPEPGQYGVRLRGTRLDGAIHESLYDYIIDFKRPPKKRTKKEPTIKQEAETFDSTGKLVYLIFVMLFAKTV